MTRRPTPLLILDLDGTVRHGKDQLGRFVNGPDDVVVFPEAIDRMNDWHDRGGRIIGVTNQGGIALGIVDYNQIVAAIDRTRELTGGRFDSIQLCPHHPDAVNPADAQCWCRKPRPGLAIQGAVLLAQVYRDEFYPAHLALMVGDRPEDAGCADALGVRFIQAEAWRSGFTWPEDRS